MCDEFEEAWTEKEEARKVVHGTLTGGSAFRALRTACKKLREVIQAAEDRYLEVFACELEEFIGAGDLRGWYGHLKGGWTLQGKKLRGAQYIRDENGKLLRKLDEIRARWRRYFTSFLNTTSATLNRTIIEGLSQKPTVLSLGDPPVVSETKNALRSMANGKAMGNLGSPGPLYDKATQGFQSESCLGGWRCKDPSEEVDRRRRGWTAFRKISRPSGRSRAKVKDGSGSHSELLSRMDGIG